MRLKYLQVLVSFRNWRISFFKLDISHNDIFKIDVGIHNFKRLNFLNLENNNLESIEEVILNIPKEDVEVKLRGNNLANSEKLRLINLKSKIVSL